MKNLFQLLITILLFNLNATAQTPASYNQFKVVTAAWQIAQAINTTPSNDPVYLVLAPGNYRIARSIVIDRVGAVYIHGLSMAGTLLTDSTTFVGQDLFIVKKTNKFSLAGLTIRTSKPASSDPNLWKSAGIRFETNASNMPHDVEIQEIEQGSSFKINAPGTYRVQSSRVPNWGYIVNHPNADFTMMQAHSWVYLGNYPKPKSATGSFLDNYSLNHPDDIAFMRDSACVVWQKQGRVRIYNTNNVMSGCAYEYRFDSKSNLGPHIIAGLRNEIEANAFPSLATCEAGNRIFKALVKVSGYGNEIIFKSNSTVKSAAFFDGVCAEKIALVDFQSVDGKAFILGNPNKEGCNKLIMNSANTNLGNAQIVLLGNKIASLPAYPNMASSTSIPQSLYADVKLGNGKSIYNMGNMTRLNTGVHPATGNYLTGAENYQTYGDEVFSDLFLSNSDSLQNAPTIPSDHPPHALTLPKFALSYNPTNPADVTTNHELLWKNILINVRNYGAIPNDENDDFAAIQTAIDTAAVSNSLLYFPEGEYYISQTLEFNTMQKQAAPTRSTTHYYGSATNLGFNNNLSGRSVLIAGADENLTIINGVNNVLSIFSITNSRMSRMQGLTLKVNQGKIKAIRGVTNANNPSQAIVAVDNFDICRAKGVVPEYASIYLWSFRNCNFLGGQVGVATQMRKQMSGVARNHKTGQNQIGIFSGSFDDKDTTCTTKLWGGLGESFAVTNCKFENNNIGFVTAHHQAFCHFVSDCQFINDTLGISQYGARGTDHLWAGALTGYTGDNAGGNFTVLHSNFNCLSRDFQTTFQTQTVPDYFNGCTFNAPTALFYFGDNYPSLQNNWLPHYRRNKNTIGFVENSIFGYDHTQDALYKNPSIVNTPRAFEDYFKYFTFVAQNMSSIFCLNSDLTKTTFIKSGVAPQEASPANNTAQLQGVGYGMIAQCKMPGQPNSTFSFYGSKPALGSFHFNFNALTRRDKNGSPIAQSNPPYPQGYGVTPPIGLYTPRYSPKEIVRLDMTSTQPTNDYYFWRIGLMASGGTLARHLDFALPMQRILLYNAGNQVTTNTKDLGTSKKIDLSLFPNPAQDLLNVQFQSENTAAGELKVCDILGRTLYTEKITMATGLNHFTLNLADFEDGLLLICLTTRNGSVSKKIVKH